MWNIFLTALVLAALAVSGPVRAADTAHAGYRLTGVIAVGADYLGFVERPQGEQVLVRRGSVLDGGKVARFDSQSLRIEFPDGAIDLMLEGSGRPPTVDRSKGIVLSGDQQGATIRRQVAPQSLKAALGAAAPGATGADAKGTGAGKAGVRSEDPEENLAERFAPLLDLPADSRVTAVNESDVRSAQSAIKIVNETLARRMPVRLTLETPDGPRRVYLMPQAPAPTQPH